MRVVFMGTPSFAVPCLAALQATHDVAAVYTRPDRPAGRGRKETASAVKRVALETGTVLEQPESLRGSEAVAVLGRYRPDVVCVAAYGQILPPDLLAVPPLGCLNVHASLLPSHRGAAPVERSILEGDPVTGVSIMRMEEGLDTGPYAVRVETAVDDLTADQLRETLSHLGAAALVSVLADLAADRVVWTAQDDAAATYAEKVSAADVALHPGLTVAVALRRVRASGRSAPCRALIAGRLVVVETASAADVAVAPGVVEVSGGQLVLGVTDGAVCVGRLVPAGKRGMTAVEFVRGARLADGVGWGGAL